MRYSPYPFLRPFNWSGPIYKVCNTVNKYEVRQGAEDRTDQLRRSNHIQVLSATTHYLWLSYKTRSLSWSHVDLCQFSIRQLVNCRSPHFLRYHSHYTLHLDPVMADILTQLQTCLDQVSTLTICFLSPTANTIPTTQLATQFYATLGYLTTYHDNSPATPPPNVPNAAPALARISKNIPSPPIPASVAAGTAGGASAAQQASPIAPPTQQPGTTAGEAPEAGAEDPNLPPQPDSPRTFAARQRELARDLIIKEQQIEYLISVLPGIGASESEQEARIRELETQLREVEKERAAKALELRRLRGRLDGVLGAVSVGIYGDREGQKGRSTS